jgi:hypothetical protein
MLRSNFDLVNLIIAAFIVIYLLLLPGNAGSQSPTPPFGELTPFEPTPTATGTATGTATATPTTEIVISPLPTATNTRRPRPTIEGTPVRVGSNAHLPIIFK